MKEPILFNVDPEVAKERVMMERLLDKAKDFYKDPKNLQAYQAWKKNKEELKNGTDHSNI